MTPLRTIENFLDQKHIAIAGVSRQKGKFGNIIYNHLKDRGYIVYPINPVMETFEGNKVYNNIEDLPNDVSALLTVTKPHQTITLIEQAKKRGILNVWMQKGSESEEAIEMAKSLGTEYVTEHCIMMFAKPVTSIHNFHRFFVKLFGKYPS